jgi:DNA-binding NarL/FixJ family response regulator
MTVLILDDHPSMLHILSSMVQELFPEMRVIEISDLKTATLSIIEKQPDFVITDIQIDSIKQMDLPKICWERKIPCMVFTGHANASILEIAIEYKVRSMVSKSASLDDLKEGIGALIQGRTFYCGVCSDILNVSNEEFDFIPPPIFTESEELVIKAQIEGKSTIQLSREIKKSKNTIRNQRMSLMEKNECSMEEVARRYLFWNTKG